MTTHRSPAAGPGLVPPVLATGLSAFRDCFTAPVWKHVLVLVAGAVLAPGKRTVSEVLRVMGLAARPGFARYHEVLSRARWNGRAVARKLLAQVLDVFLPTGEVGMASMTRSSAAGATRSRRAASTGIRCARRTATSSRPAACGGCR